MIHLLIPEKITDEQLLAGKKIKISYHTEFNGRSIDKVFPDDFTLEEQELFKKVYEDAVYGSEVGNNIFRCHNNENSISISGYKRTGASEDDILHFDNTQPINLKFTRHGLRNKSVEINSLFSEVFTSEDIASLKEIGILVSGTVNEFEVTEFDGDISIEVIKEATDSFIDLGGFKDGKLILQK